MYSDIGRPSIPPEQLLRALLLQYLYAIRSERLLMEEMDSSVLFRWVIGLGMDDPIWTKRGRYRGLVEFFLAVGCSRRVTGLFRPAPCRSNHLSGLSAGCVPSATG